MRLFLVIGMILLVLVTACSARPNNDEESMSLVEEMVHSKLRLSKRDDNDYEDEQDDEYDEDDYEEGDEVIKKMKKMMRKMMRKMMMWKMMRRWMMKMKMGRMKMIMR